MGFILRIFFSGLIALVPSHGGKELTVLLLNVDHSFEVSDGTTLAHHQPMLLARAGSCVGDCTTDDPDIAQFLFSDLTPTDAVTSLGNAVTSGGNAWQLSGSDLFLNKGCSRDHSLPPLALELGARTTVGGQPEIIPTTATERADFSWVTHLSQVCPSCGFNPALLGPLPSSGVVAARLHLRSGHVFTYSVVRIGTPVTPVHFQPLDGGTTSPYSQAVANWVEADIAVPGETVELVEEKVSGTRTVSLAPGANNQVEMAVLNIPEPVPPPGRTTDPAIGKHFEAFYNIAAIPPASDARPVPKQGPADPNASYPNVDWDTIHPRPALASDLLTAIRLDIGRAPYDKSLCPMVQQP